MNWSKVNKGKYPLGWWYHKVLCEFGWAIRNIIGTEKYYYYHLHKLCKYGYNLYGEPIRKFE
jgi:hypothetical protein